MFEGKVHLRLTAAEEQTSRAISAYEQLRLLTLFAYEEFKLDY
jgi:hypothetical protein